MRKKKKTAFVLSGGGVFGAVQVGMVKALYEAEIRPDLIVGCSVGALNGAVLAQWPGGEGLERLIATWQKTRQIEIFSGSKVARLLRAFRDDHIFPRDGLEQIVDENLRFELIEELPIEFKAVACDLDTGEEVVLSSGPIRPALLASSALPGAFAPVIYEGRRLIDGGVVNNVPITVADRKDVSKLYVLNVAAEIEIEATKTAWDVVYRAFNIAKAQRWLSELQRYASDERVVVMPRPEIETVDFDDFSRVDQLMESGYSMSREYLKRLAA